MKLSDVLSEVGAESRTPAKAIRDQHLGESQEAKAADNMPAGGGGYHKTGRAKTVHKQTTCCRCGHPIRQGETAVALKNDGWSCLTWVHPHCEDGYGQAASTEQIETIANRLDSALLSEIDELKAKLVDLAENQPPATIRVQLPDRDVDLEDEHVHPAFDEIVDLVADGEDVFLPGPTGCGKSHVVEQVAKALDRTFGSISCSGGTTESHIFGRMVPYGEQGQFEFLGTEFLRCYENGGVFLLDEMDAADENVLIAINSALANGLVSVPSRHENPTARRHPDFVCVAAANTFGHGADRQYVGRTQLDEATLDRFRFGTVEMDYDRDLEKKLCPISEIRERMDTYRTAIARHKLERVVSTRFLIKAYRAYQRWQCNGKTYGYTDIFEYIDAKLMKGWSEREIMAVRGRLPEKE